MRDGCTDIGLGCEYCPALPERPFTPGYFYETADFGWNAGGVSDAELTGNVHVVMMMDIVVGVIAGFTPLRTGVNYDRITHGFYFHDSSGPVYSIVENGEVVISNIPYDAGDSFEIRREFGVVRYYVQFSLVYLSALPSSGLISVGASLYASGDTIPSIEFAVFGDNEVTGESDGSLVISGYSLQSASPGVCFGSLTIDGYGTLVAMFDEEIPNPGLPNVVIGDLYVTGDSDGFSSILDGDGDGTLYISGLSASGNLSQGTLYISGQASSEFVLGNYAFMISEEPVTFGYAGFESLLIQEDLSVGSEPISMEHAVINILMGLRWNGITENEGTTVVTESLELGDSVAVIIRVAVEEGLVFEGDIVGDYLALERVIHVLMLSNPVITEAEAYSVITDAIAFEAIVAAIAKNTVTESFTMADVVTQVMNATQQIIEALAIEEVQSNTVTGTVIVDENLELEGLPVTQGEFFNAIREGLNFVLSIDIDNGQFIAWSMEVDKKGLSKYTNYPFNSFCKLGDQYFGATDSGIFLMEGSDDAGEDIQAKVRLAMTTMGSMAMKGIPYMYLGYTASNGLYIKANITNKEGVFVSHLYKLLAQPTDAMRTARVKLGDGLQAVYFGWEIQNVDGGDLNIDHIQWVPVYADRKAHGKNGRG